MGLRDLDGVGKPDNKGGRPPKSDDGDSKREVDGEPFTNEHGEEYWSRMWREYYSVNTEVIHVVRKVAEETYCLPRTVVKEVHENEIFDFEETDRDTWIDWINEDEPSDETSTRSTDHEDISGGLSSLLG